MADYLQHRAAVLQQKGKFVWRYWETRGWINFAPSTNSEITQAFKVGQTYCRYRISSRRYIIHFATMQQTNEDTGFSRPVVLQIRPFGPNESATEPAVAESSLMQLKTISESMKGSLLHACIDFMKYPVDPDALHAIMRVVLRMTRSHQYAGMFLDAGGLKNLLKIKHKSGFSGFPTLATLLLRHCIEEPVTLRHTMEKVVRGLVQSGGQQNMAVFDPNRGIHDIDYLLRQLGPVAARDPKMFVEVSKRNLRIKVPPPKRSTGVNLFHWPDLHWSSDSFYRRR
jgi:E3 ubiquitin-protein ligase HUWE1